MTSAAVITAAAVALGVVVVTHEGFATTDVTLHDGGIWVTNPDMMLVGHLNYQARELDGGFNTGSRAFDVQQDGNDVLMIDEANGMASAVDPANFVQGASVRLPGQHEIALGGGTVAILDRGTGGVWVMPFSQLHGFSPESSEPLLEVGQDAAIDVGLDGTVHIASPESGTQYTLDTDAGEVLSTNERHRSELEGAGALQVTALGDQAVVLDGDNGVLLLPNAVETVEDSAVLQQSGPTSDQVAVATSSALFLYPITGGSPERADYGKASGEPVAPVQTGGCTYAAFPSTATFVRDCVDDARDLEQFVDTMAIDAPVVFRENRGLVVLNDLTDGLVWMVNENLYLVDNWDDLIPPESEETTDEESDSVEEEIQNVPPPPTEENHAPVAVDDTFGARAGRSTILPIILNDSDEDGDILTAQVVSELPAWATIEPVANDSQFQLTLDEQASGTFTFQYEIHDGRDGTDTATVTVSVRTAGQNDAPVLARIPTIQVEQSASVDYAVLADWYDPDGDDFYLSNAVSASGDDIQFRPNGLITYTATGDPGLTEVEITVFDGEEYATGTLYVDVRERGEGQPLANNDFVMTVVGREITIAPLANDTAPNGANLRLARVDEVAGLTITTDFETGVVTIVGETEGIYYVNYLMTDGPHSVSGRIRVDIRGADDEALPVAVRDIVLLPQTGEALTDLIQNDVDPGAGILVVTGVSVPPGSSVTVELLERRVLRVVDSGGLRSPITITYTVSNGYASTTGEIVIVPVEPSTQPRPPVAVDDQYTLREGDVLTMHVLNNDYSPDNIQFSLDPALVESSLAGDHEGVAFVDGDLIRLHVLEGGPSSVSLTYQVIDEYGQADAGLISIRIIPRDPEVNAAPIPGMMTARVIAGTSVEIPIMLDGIDPNGDGVELVGIASSPDQGIVEVVGPSTIMFTAFPDATGTTSFTYRVRDRFNLTAIGTVLVGIAPPESMNQAPFAQPDLIIVRPDRAISIPVMANDSDPDGDPLSLIANGIETGEGLGQVEIVNGALVLRSPEQTGDYSIQYTIQDDRGASALGTVVIQVRDDAPLLPPVAVDDVVNRLDATLGEPLDVQVLENDLDPDGDPLELVVTVVTGDATVDAGAVTVTPTEEFQVITYRVTDIDGNAAEAFVLVPPVTVLPPYLDPTRAEGIVVPSGEQIEIELSQYVITADGTTPRVTTNDSVSVQHGNGDELVIDADTLVYTSADNYHGPDAISFEATDGDGPDDPNGLTSVIQIPITVLPPSNVDPSFGGIVLEVEPGEDPITYDLRLATSDPDVGDLDSMEYELVDPDVPGVSVSIDGQTLSASADLGTPIGTQGSVLLDIRDQAGNEVNGTVSIVVISSRRAPALPQDDTMEATQGIASSINPLTNDVNPFADRGAPLEVVGAELLSGTGQVTFTGDSVTVTPGGDFHGVMTIAYTVRDATGDPLRDRQGTITATVIGRPDAPIRPNVLEEGDSMVVLSWTPPNANGAPIQDYLVRSTDGTFEQVCASTTCTLSGLVNNHIYTFVVHARNEVGESDPSPPSAEARPDVLPETPAPPTVVRGDTQVTVTWTAPINRGSPITHYNLRISPAPDNDVVQIDVGNTTTFVWTGLTNGTAYTFEVQAVNSARGEPQFSAPSQSVTPAGPPFQPTGVTVNRIDSVGQETQMQVSWTAPGSNGDPIQHYIVTPSVGTPFTVEGSQTTAAVRMPVSATAYTFTVTAVNGVGPGQPSAPSAPRRAINPPEAVASVSATPGDRVITVQFPALTQQQLNGASASEVQYIYQLNTGQSGTIAAGGGQIAGLSNNTTYTVTIIAQTVADGSTYQSAGTVSNQVIPFGPPGQPTASATSGVGSVTVSWGAPASNGRPVTLQINYGAGWATVSGSGSQTIAAAAGQTITLQVQATDSEGQTSGIATASAQSRGPASGYLTQGAQTTSPVNGQTWPNVVLNYSWIPPGTYSYTCSNNNGQFQSGTWNNTQMSGSTSSSSYTFCVYAGNEGPAVLRIMGVNGQTLTATGSW